MKQAVQSLKLIWNLCRANNTDVPSCTVCFILYSPDTVGYLSTFNVPTTDICIVVWRSYITKFGWLVESWVGYGGCGNHSFFTSCFLISGLIWIVAFGSRGQKLHIIVTVLYVLFHIQIDPVWDMHAISLPLWRMSLILEAFIYWHPTEVIIVTNLSVRPVIVITSGWQNN